jgi:1-acyl-sn-glycerol-3-phosphate acyltransferase
MHSRPARFLFNTYIDRLLKTNFGHFYIAGAMPVFDPDRALLLTPNHMSWWDGFFSDYFVRTKIRKKNHLMMLEKQLRRYWFFNLVGAYSIKPESPLSALASIKYTRRLLRSPGTAVIMYPQGEIRGYDERPLGLKEGVRLLVGDKDRFDLLVPSFRINYYNEKKPDIVVYPGKLEQPGLLLDFKIYEEIFASRIEECARASHKREFTEDLFK